MSGSEKKLSLVVNGEEMQLPPESRIVDLLERLEVNRAGIAVELNAEIAPADCFGNTVLQDGDVVEIVSLVGGG